MKWDEMKKGSSTIYTSTCEVTTWAELADALSDFWLKLADSAHSWIGRKAWNRLLLELWIDSGRIIGYPHMRGALQSDWSVAVQVLVPMLLSASEELPDPDDDPERFESEAIALEAQVWVALKKATRNPEVRKALRSLKQATPFQIWRQSADNEETGLEFFLVY